MSNEVIKLTPVEQAMNWERMSGERLSDAERQRIMDGGDFSPPAPQICAAESAMAKAIAAWESQTSMEFSSDGLDAACWAFHEHMLDAMGETK